MINQLREIHTGVMGRRNVALGITVDRTAVCQHAGKFTDTSGQTVQPALPTGGGSAEHMGTVKDELSVGRYA